MTLSDDDLVITPTADGISVSGEIDTHTAPSLAAAIAAADRRELTLDFSGVEFIDSSGLRVLIQAHRKAAESGGTLRLSNPSAMVRRVLDISGLDDHLDVV